MGKPWAGCRRSPVTGRSCCLENGRRKVFSLSRFLRLLCLSHPSVPFLQNSASPRKGTVLCKSVLIPFLFWVLPSVFPIHLLQVTSGSSVCSLKPRLLVKTPLLVLILSRYWQIGVFTLVIEASCAAGGFTCPFWKSLHLTYSERRGVLI